MRNLTLLTDFYQLTMMQVYHNSGIGKNKAVFDLFYRSNPFNGGFAIAAGLNNVIDYINNLSFSKEDIAYLRETGAFTEKFLAYLCKFRFTGHMRAIPEGTVVFPMEPLITVEAPIMEAQFIETALLNMVNHQTLIATKACRIRNIAGDSDTLLEFGLRRAQGADAGTDGARAAIIGGFNSTSNVLSGEKYGAHVSGTHAHALVMSFPTEYEAFTAYSKSYPKACILLVDTYDTLRQGVPNAIKVFNNMKQNGTLPAKGSGMYGIRLDSGDLAYISKKARKMLDDAGFTDAVISASSDLDEYLIESLKGQGAKITVWGVGTNLITAKDCPALGGVYKLSAVEENGKFVPKLKVSDNTVKITNPGKKQVLRIVDKETGKIRADLIHVLGETFDIKEDIVVFDPVDTWKVTRIKGGTYNLINLLKDVYIDGAQVYGDVDLYELQDYCKRSLNMLWDETKRLANPHKVYVDLSDKLWNIKNDLLNSNGATTD